MSLGQLTDYYFPPYITLSHIFNAPRGWGLNNRILKQYAFEFVVSGKADYSIEGQSYPLTRGDLLLIRPYEIHSVHTYPDSDYVSISIVFHFANFPFPFEELFNLKRYLGNYSSQAAEHYISELVAKYNQPRLHNHTLCQGLLLMIFSETSVWKNNQQTDFGHQPKNIARMVLIKNYIADHYYEEINPKELEDKFRLTWNYIINQFNKKFGITPTQFLTRVRIAKAKELALQSNLSFGEIAERIGYSDVHAFGKMFKKKTGMSLTEFCSSVCGVDHDITWPKNE